MAKKSLFKVFIKNSHVGTPSFSKKTVMFALYVNKGCPLTFIFTYIYVVNIPFIRS